MLRLFRGSSEYPNYGELAAESHFSQSELRAMYKRFLSMAQCPDPQAPTITWLSKENFLQQSEVVFCALAARAFDFEAEECQYPGFIDFDTYVGIFSHFSSKASLDEKKICTSGDISHDTTNTYKHHNAYIYY
jgi:Zn ribbon nucleic-acid-binding protein